MRFLVFFLAGLAWSQGPACTFKGSFSTATTGVPYANNTANPNCNSFALTWNTTGFTAVTIQLEGADVQTGPYTAFSGSTTVLVGTNPASTLSGAIIVQTSSTIAFIRVNLTSATGSGAVNYQVYGYNGVTPTAKLGGGGGSGVTAVTATLPIVSSGGSTPDISCPTCATSAGSGIVTTWTAGTGGVLANTLVCVSSATAIECDTNSGNTAPTVLGVALANATAGNPVNVQTGPGITVGCVFENTATANDIVTTGTTTAGDCHDYGPISVSAMPLTKPYVGVVLSSGTGLQNISFVGPGANGATVQATSPVTTTGASIGINHVTGERGGGNLLQLSTGGAVTSGHCVEFDSTGNTVDAGAPCSSSTGNFGTITSGNNTAATMTVGTGALLAPLGAGIINATSLVDANQLPAVTIVTTPSAVDYLTVTDAAAGSPATVAVSPGGSDSNVNLLLQSKGSGAVELYDGANPLLITPGTNNLFFGIGSGNLSLTGYSNLAIMGLANVTSGNTNISVGSTALNSCTSCAQNMAVGPASLFNVTGGSSNTAVGFESGYNSSVVLNSLGTCTFIGASSTASANGLSNCMAIGAGASVAMANQTVIGSTAVTMTLINGAVALGSSPFATASLPLCVGSTGTVWRASVNDAVAPAIGVVLTGGGSVFALVHCSLTTGTYIVDGL